MTTETLLYPSRDRQTQIHAKLWIPEGEIRGILQISHGMVEHIGRYEDFAAFLAKAGFLVAGNDHLGHGDSIRSPKQYGYFAKEKGNEILLKDLHTLQKILEKRYKGLPRFFLGHSMGSFLLRQYLCLYGESLSGAIIMGTGWHSRAEALLGMGLTRALAAVFGWEKRSRLVDLLAFGGYGRGIKKARTDRDWLTKDEDIVDAYIKDERCSFLFTLNGYYNLFASLLDLTRKEKRKEIPKELPVLFVSGLEDPVGAYGKGVLKAARELKEAGLSRVSVKLYPGDRHEILNELDRAEVYRDLENWLADNLRSEKFKCTF